MELPRSRFASVAGIRALGMLGDSAIQRLNLTSPSAITFAETAVAETLDGRRCGDAELEAKLDAHRRGERT
jgi:hypothetical protein